MDFKPVCSYMNTHTGDYLEMLLQRSILCLTFTKEFGEWSSKGWLPVQAIRLKGTYFHFLLISSFIFSLAQSFTYCCIENFGFA